MKSKWSLTLKTQVLFLSVPWGFRVLNLTIQYCSAWPKLNSGRVGFQVGARLTETTRLGSSVSNSIKISIWKFLLFKKNIEFKKIWIWKNFGFNNFFGLRIIFGSKWFFGQNNFLGLKNFQCQKKYFREKIIWSMKIF